MQSLSKADEQRLLDGVKQATDLVDNQGMSPNDALQKIAEDLEYSPGFLKAACNAFNNGRQLAQWNANDSVLDKLASFPLADYDEIRERIWEATPTKTASDHSMFSPVFQTYEDMDRQALLDMPLPSMEKAASDELHPAAADEHADMRAHRSYSNYEFNARQVEEARREKTAAEDLLHLKLHLLDTYFQKFAYERLPFAQVEAAVSTYFGKPGRALMGYVAERFPNEKRASDHQSSWEGFRQPVDRTQEPYTLVEAAIKQAQELHQADEALQEATQKLAEAKEGVAPFSPARHPKSESSQLTLTPSLLPEDVGNAKEAGVFGGLAGGFGLGAARSMADSATQGSEKKVDSQVEELESPDHLNEIRKVKAQTLLTQLMSDPESPLSQHDPEEVLTAYNELVQMSPRLADQPSAIGPLLNKRLMGNTEPFEVGETINLEKGLKDTQGPRLPPPKSNPGNKPENKPIVDLMKNEASILS